jgi:hypothetical protein
MHSKKPYASFISVPENPDLDISVCKDHVTAAARDNIYTSTHTTTFPKVSTACTTWDDPLQNSPTKTAILEGGYHPKKRTTQTHIAIFKSNTVFTKLDFIVYRVLIFKLQEGPINHNVHSPTICNCMGSHNTITTTKDLYLYIGAWWWLFDESKHVACVVRKYNKYRCVWLTKPVIISKYHSFNHDEETKFLLLFWAKLWPQKAELSTLHETYELQPFARYW